jgi:hypothetical protein
MNFMKTKSMILSMALILVLSACKKDSETVPSSTASAATTEKSGSGSSDTTKCKGQGAPKGVPPAPEELIAKLDTDKDGKISRSEAQGPLAKDFDKVDADKDNFITLDELKKMGPPKQGMCPPKQTAPNSN